MPAWAGTLPLNKGDGSDLTQGRQDAGGGQARQRGRRAGRGTDKIQRTWNPPQAGRPWNLPAARQARNLELSFLLDLIDRPA